MIFNFIGLFFLLFILAEFFMRLIKYLRTKKWEALALDKLLEEKKYSAYQAHTYIGYTKSKNITNPRFPSNNDSFVGSQDISMIRSKEANTIRIVVCGGSTVEQNDLDMISEFDPDLTWPKAMESALNSTDKEKTYEVINAGCAGYTILESTIHFLTKCIPYKPDYVILYTGINDAWCIQTLEGFKADYTHARRPPIFPSGKGILKLLPNIPLSFVYQYTLWYLSKWLEKPSSLISYISNQPNFNMTSDQFPIAVKTYEEYLRSFCGIALAHGITPILIPWLFEKELVNKPPFINRWDQEKFLELLEMNNKATRQIAKATNGAVLIELPSVGKEGFRLSNTTGHQIQHSGLDWIHFSKVGLIKMGNNVAHEFLKIHN